MNKLATAKSLESHFYRIKLVRRIDRWLHAVPRLSLVVEIAPQFVAAARAATTLGSGDIAVQPLPTGSVMPSPIETNVTQPDAIRSALRQVFSRVPVEGEQLALLVPDPVIRVFILPFDTFPRRAEDALPLLRWRLKKSVPFDVEEAVISWMRQPGREGSVEIVAAVARQRIIREYEQVIEELGGRPTAVVSSTLAMLPLLEDPGATLLVRFSGRTLTTVIARGANLCVYRSAEMMSDQLSPQSVLEEVFPAVAYYQDSWGTPVDRALLSGFGDNEEALRPALADELKVEVSSILARAASRGRAEPARDLMEHGLASMAGWMLNEA